MKLFHRKTGINYFKENYIKYSMLPTSDEIYIKQYNVDKTNKTKNVTSLGVHAYVQDTKKMNINYVNLLFPLFFLQKL